jgi:hypothetical protein
METRPSARPDSAAERAARLIWDPLRHEGAESARQAAAARRAGLIQAAVGFVAAGWLAWRVGRTAAAIAAGVALTVAVLALVSPLGGLARLERAVRRFAGWVGTAVGWLLMTPLYYFVITPLGVLLRWRGKLRIRRRPDPRAETYWTVLPDPQPGPAPYEKQF